VHLQTIAEGIETADQLATLRRIGCWAGQGYLWSPAVPIDELTALVPADKLRGLTAVGARAQSEPLRFIAGHADLLARRYQDQLDDTADRYIGYA
jgi:hypothetical protein